ncbi:MAG: xylulokinase [Pseudomonadota bacterium]
MYLGLDLGTSGLRGLLVDSGGTPVAEATREYAVSNPEEGWSEQDPKEWVLACVAVLAELQKKATGAYAGIVGIGVSGHMHGAVLLDDNQQVIRPCILWNDVRSARQAAELDAVPGFREITGNIVFPGFTAPKLAWMAVHEPKLSRQVATVMLPKDYLVFWLTGIVGADISDASGTSWLDVGQRNWSSKLIEASGMSETQLPPLREGSDIVGILDKERAVQLNLGDAVQVVAGGADNACAACGIGALKEGQGFASLGTSGVVLLAKDSYVAKPDAAVHTFCHAVPEKWYQMGVSLSATDSLNWLSSNLGSDPETLAQALPDKASGPSNVMFLPYLTGERTPHNDAEIRGVFTGLSKTSDHRVLTQAVMEGVSFALRDCLEALRQTGSNPASLIAVGGGSKSEFWVSTLANTLGVNIDIPENGEFGAAMGAARLAMIGAGGLSVEIVLSPPKIEKTITPDPTLLPLYEAAFNKYKNTYLALKDIA